MSQLLSIPDVRALACDCLTRAGVPDPIARDVAAEIAAAEAAGERAHGMEALLRDIRLLRYGRLQGAARPEMSQPRPGLVRVDARHGFAAPALLEAAPHLANIAGAQGIAMIRLERASPPGAMIRAVRRIVEHGLTVLALGSGGDGRIARPGWHGTAPVPRPNGGGVSQALPQDTRAGPDDSPLGGAVDYGAWIVAVTEDGVETGLFDAALLAQTPAPPQTQEIAFSVDLLEQIVTA